MCSRVRARVCVRRGELPDGSDESTEKNTRARQTSTGVKRTLHLSWPPGRSTEKEEEEEDMEPPDGDFRSPGTILLIRCG